MWRGSLLSLDIAVLHCRINLCKRWFPPGFTLYTVLQQESIKTSHSHEPPGFAVCSATLNFRAGWVFCVFVLKSLRWHMPFIPCLFPPVTSSVSGPGCLNSPAEAHIYTLCSPCEHINLAFMYPPVNYASK